MTLLPISTSSLFSNCGPNCVICIVHKKKKKPCERCEGNGCKGAIDRVAKCTIRICSEVKDQVACLDCDKYPCKKMFSMEKKYLELTSDK